RLVMRRVDCVVAVSEAQAVKVRRAGVAPRRVAVVCNAVPPEAFAEPDPAARAELEALFAERPARVVGAAGRLSPEKGFEKLIEAAALVRRQRPDVGFVV